MADVEGINHFDPSIRRARGLRWAMDKALWESVGDMLEELGEAPETKSGAPADVGPTDLLDYAAYFDLDSAQRTDVETAPGIKERAVAHLRKRLAQGVPVEPEARAPRITNYDTSTYTAEQLDQMSRWWDIEPANRMALTAATEEELARVMPQIAKAMSYLEAAAPEVFGEIQLIVRDIVLAKPDGTNLVNYSGASSFGLWGAITINAETQCDWTQLYRQIVHEAAHNQLFAIAREAPLVKADRTVRRRSPIRADPRPLDGIYHAAYVSAREALVLEALLQLHEDGGQLSEEDVAIIEDTLELSVLAYWDCIATLRGDDQGPTEFGEAVLADCDAYMKANFDLEPC